MMTEYENECMIYLAIQILEMLELKNKWLLIDNYYEKIRFIANDYKQYDNNNKSLLDSINDYINDNKEKILNNLKDCFDE